MRIGVGATSVYLSDWEGLRVSPLFARIGFAELAQDGHLQDPTEVHDHLRATIATLRLEDEI